MAAATVQPSLGGDSCGAISFGELNSLLAVLRSVKTLETINGKAANEFWNEVEEKKQ